MCLAKSHNFKNLCNLARKLVNTILYADDQILKATLETDLQTAAHHLNFIARKYKMTISSTKTKS